jgi:asparagine synthase (glutamine-hydrolysing)
MVTGAVVTLMAARHAKSQGLKVVLCGEGADEIFAGYKTIRSLPWPQLIDASWQLIGNLHNTECKRLDRMTMAVSLEARVPFLDRSVVEYALNLPCEAKLVERGGRKVEKHILRQAFEGILPEEILWREKMPFDQGSGGRHIIDHVNQRISDPELADAQKQWPEAQIASKEMLYYYRIWREHFGDMGGQRVFDLFGNYPVMMDNITTRTAQSGS